jgi:hypothetical protein
MAMLLKDDESHFTQPEDQIVKGILRKFSRSVSKLPRWMTRSRFRARTQITAGEQKQGAKPTRIKAVADWFSSIRNLLVNILIIAVVILVPYVLVTQVKSTSITVRPISVPEGLSKSGYTPEVFAMRVATEMARIDREAGTLMPRKGIAWSEAKPDIQIPGESISLRAVVQYIKEFLDIKDIIVSIDVTGDKSGYIAQIRIIGGPYNGKQGSAISLLNHNYDEFVLKVAEEAMHIAQPYVWASYVTSVEEARCDNNKPFNSSKCIALYDEILNTSLSDHDRKWALLGKGYVLGKLGANEEEIECYRKATKIDPKFADAYFNWGNALQALNKHDEAILKYEKAIELDPKFVDARKSRSPDSGAVSGSPFIQEGRAVRQPGIH